MRTDYRFRFKNYVSNFFEQEISDQEIKKIQSAAILYCMIERANKHAINEHFFALIKCSQATYRLE